MAGFDDFVVEPQAKAEGFSTFLHGLHDAESSLGTAKGINRPNSAGAVWDLQVTPIAAKDVGADYEAVKANRDLAWDTGKKYAKKVWDKFAGDPTLAAAAYHTGPTEINRWIREAKAFGTDPREYVLNRLGPEGKVHNQKVLNQFDQGAYKSEFASFDVESGTFTSRDPESPRGSVPRRSFSDFDQPAASDLGSDAGTRDYKTINPNGSVNWEETFAKTLSDAKSTGKNIAGLANLVASMPAFVVGTAGGLGSATVGAIGSALGSGESARSVFSTALKHGEYLTDVSNRLFNPISVALNVLKSPEALDDTVANKAMGELTTGIKDYARHVEKSTGNKIDSGAVEMLVNTLMVSTLGKVRAKEVDRGLKNIQKDDTVKFTETQGAEDTVARRPGSQTQDISDAEIIEPKKAAPSFDQFTIDSDVKAADAFIKETLAATEKEEAATRLKKRLTAAAVVSAPAVAAGGAYVYNKMQSTGNQLIDPQQQEHDVPFPKPGNEIAGRTVTGEDYDKLLNQFGSLAAIPFAIGAVKGKGGMWHPEAVERLSNPLKKSLNPLGELANRAIDRGQEVGEAIQAKAEEAKLAMNWSDRAIRNYLNKYAGTEGDPLKDVEVPFAGEAGTRKWGELTDAMIKPQKAGIIEEQDPKARSGETIWRVDSRGEIDLGDIGQGRGALAVANATSGITDYLSHVGDYLRQNVDPAKLQQYDLVRAVKETAKNDERVAKEMEKASAASTKDLPVYKEYPDGMKWVELKLPEKLTGEQLSRIRKHPELKGAGNYEALGTDGKPIINSYTNNPAEGSTPQEAHLAGQLAQEGNQMGHCVGGYCEGVASGESRIFSLRDKKGQSHVTIEVDPRLRGGSISGNLLTKRFGDRGMQAWEATKGKADTHGILQRDFPDIWKKLTDAGDILQIKGKQNRAPVAEYLPYVQDFVKSGKWGEVGDLGNTGLLRVGDKLLTPDEIKPWAKKFYDTVEEKGIEGNYPHRINFEREPNLYSNVVDEINLFNDRNIPPQRKTPNRGSRNQQGFADPRLVKALALAGVGATVGASLFPDDRLTAALVGGVLALGLGHTKVSALPQLLAPGSKLARSAERGIEASVQQFIRNVNPDLMGKQAESAASVLGKNYTEMMQRQLGIEVPSQKRSEFWFRQGTTRGRAFLKAMEKGVTFTDPTMQAYAIAYRTWMNKIFKQDELGGIKYEPVDNYVYHAFEDPVGAAAFFEKKYGVKWGDPSFTKDRTFELIEEAEKEGFKLKTENPEQLMVMRQHASDIASMKVQALRDLAEYGLARRIEKGKPAITGESTWRSPNGELYALPDQTNQVMHNAFNTPSLWADPGVGGQVFRALSYAKNAIVPVQLFGLFHPLHVQLGMSFADPLTAMTKRWAAGTVPFTDIIKEGLSKFALADVLTSVIKHGTISPESGWKTLRAFRGEVPFSKLTAADKQNLNLMLEGTFNPTMPIEYRNTHMKDFRRAVLENSAMSVWHLPWAIMEKFYTKPIFEKWIPEVKTAAYLRGAYAALEANPELMQQPLERMNALRKISKMVDDRFGEVAYKTLFMNRTVKDVAVASFLSYGWQLGFVRSYVGAVPEAVKAITDKGTLREKIAKGDLDKSLFVGYYVTGTMLYAGLLTYALTGQAPKDIMDYIYPRTGEKNPDGSEARVGTPFYTREFISIPKHMQEEGVMKGLATTIGNKLSPAIGMLKAMVTNKDFFNREISNPDAGMMENLGQRLGYAFKAMEPISISSADKGPPGVKTQVLSTAGFTPAPKYVTDTAIEQKIKHEYGKYHQSTIPYAQARKMEDRTELYRLKQLGEDDKFEEGLDKMKEKYNMTSGEVKNLRRNAEIPTAERLFSQLPNKMQEKLLGEMSADEQERFGPRAGKLLRYQ